MSTRQETLPNMVDVSVRRLAAGGLGITLSKIKARFGFQDVTQPRATVGMNAVNVKTTNWLTSIVGAFDNNPLYPQILENERQARLLDEQFIILE